MKNIKTFNEFVNEAAQNSLSIEGIVDGGNLAKVIKSKDFLKGLWTNNTYNGPHSTGNHAQLTVSDGGSNGVLNLSIVPQSRGGKKINVLTTSFHTEVKRGWQGSENATKFGTHKKVDLMGPIIKVEDPNDYFGQYGEYTQAFQDAVNKYLATLEVSTGIKLRIDKYGFPH